MSMQSPIVCPTCGKENSTLSGGNDWFCATHYAECVKQMRDDYQKSLDEAKARRIAAAAKGQETRKAKLDGTYRAPRRNMEAYRRIKENYCKRMGW